MNIRKANLRDSEVLKALYSELRAFELNLLQPDMLAIQLNWEKEKGMNEIERFLTSDDIVVFVSESEGDVFGFVTCGISKVFEYCEGSLDLFVREGHRGGGAGTALLEEAIKWFRGNGCGSFMVSVYSANAGAREFYRKRGMKLVGETYKMKL